MKKFVVTITETLSKSIEVEADSIDEAEQKISDDWNGSKILLDSADFTDVEFTAEEKAPEKIKVVLLEPYKKARIAEIDASLGGMQKIVGGRIEPGFFFNEPVCFVCNEEGKMNRLPLNRGVRDENGKLIEIIAGTAFICDCFGENFGSLSEEQLKKYSEQFKYPERFARIDGEIKAFPYQPKNKDYERS